MIKFKYPNIKVPNNLLLVTDEMLSIWEAENKECEDYNKSSMSQIKEAREKMINNAILIWGEKSNVVRYLRKTTVYIPSLTFFDSIKNRVLEARVNEKEKISFIESQQKLINLQGKAVEYLLSKGKTINIDFTLNNVLSVANSIAHEEEVLKRQKELSESSTYTHFNGDDNCEDCKGWDGSSPRCQCGNERVNWTSDKFDGFFLNPRIYAEAY